MFQLPTQAQLMRRCLRSATLLASLLAWLTLGLIACQDPPQRPHEAQPLQTRSAAIVGGQLETGWPGVGALTLREPGANYGGSFCTGALISPEWVLTAAHCLVSEDSDFTPTPSNTRFYVGNDSTGAQPVGSFYQPDRFVVHPDYSADDYIHDIALIHLGEPATGVETYAYNTINLAPYVGELAEYIGFGATEGINNSGSGVKRSTSLEILQLAEDSYYSQFNGGGICYGDSGGPALLLINGVWRIVGVNSRGGGETEDPCRAFYVSVRVDAYVDWISQELSVPPPDCRDEEGTCLCEAACQADGRCEQSTCEVMSCSELYECITGCQGDQGCQSYCSVTASPEGLEQLSSLYDCLGARCGSLEGDEYSSCVTERCAEELNLCFPRVTGTETCAQVSECIQLCRDGDSDCQRRCFDEGSEEAQELYIELSACYNERCADEQTNAGFRRCLEAECLDPYFDCIPPDDCPLTGGGCAGDEACYLGFGGRTSCYPSEGRSLGDDCEPTSDVLSCADGLVCLDGSCTRLCLEHNDCAEGERCFEPLFEGLDDGGVCLCADEDEDGVCAAEDCNDADPNSGVAGDERCGDALDNDCDGLIDEGCQSMNAGAEAGSEAGSAPPEGGGRGPSAGDSGALSGGASSVYVGDEGGLESPVASAGASSSSCDSTAGSTSAPPLALLSLWVVLGLLRSRRLRPLLGLGALLTVSSACEPLADQLDFNSADAVLLRAETLKSPRLDEAEDGTIGLRVMAWNVKYGARRLPFWFDCWGDRVSMSYDEVTDNLEALYELVREADPDVLMIEEVEVNSRRSAYVDMVQGFLDHTELNYAAYFSSWDSRYIPSEGLGRMNLGNAILSKHPIKSAARIRQRDRTDLDPLTESFYIKRVIGRATLEVGEGEVAAYVVHTEAYDVDGTKAAQIEQLMELIDQEELPFVIGGDFNELPPNAARLEGFPDEREEPVCGDDYLQPPYTPEVMRPYFEELKPSIPLEAYGDTEEAQSRFFTHSVLGGEEDNGRAWSGDWNRTLDYLFASPNSSWRAGSSDVLQRAGQEVGVYGELSSGEGPLNWTLQVEPLELSDHAPTFGVWEVKP